MIRNALWMLVLAPLCGLPAPTAPAAAQKRAPAPAAPTATDADAFVARAEKELSAFNLLANRVSWINANFITDDTDALAAEYGARRTEMSVRYAIEAAKYQSVADLSP